ncbi:MAG TPA: hypothetical protein EYG93_11155 [Sulfurospirillum arcachonense]|nr:hypothetical protein [Sulfurospirillum arcachonense]
MRNNSFFVFLSIVLGLLFAGSIAFSYFFGNFGGISLKELNSTYLLKNELRFSDLSDVLQKRYINRDKSNSRIKETKVTRIFDDEGNPLIEDMGELSEIVQSLQNKVSFLERENIIISTDKNELLKIVEHEKSKNSIEQKTLLSNNLEKINEAEQQHYQNISELTKKINDLHRENIYLSQQLNQKDDSNKDKITLLKQQIEDEKKSSKQREVELDKIYKIKSASLVNENKLLKGQFAEVNSALQSQRSYTILEIGKKDQKITMLQNKINEMMIERNTILTKNSQAILQIERDNSKKLQEFNDIVKNSSSEKEAKIEELMTKIDDLNSKILLLENSEKRVKSELDSSRITISSDKDKIFQLQDKIKVLERGERVLDDEVNEIVLINEEKHNKNYKILNEKIATIEMVIKSKQNEYEKVLLSLSGEKTELINKLSNTLQDNSKKNKQIKELKKEIDNIEKKKNELELSENEKLAKIRKSFDDLKLSISLREKEYQKARNELKADVSKKKSELQLRDKDKEKLEKYIREITSLKKTLKEIESGERVSKASNKLQKLGKVECGDMVSGNFKISSTCKAKVNKFLAQYDETNYFEVIPIVGTGGFASLSKVQRDGRLGIPDSEIKRLTRLSNIGLGRDRTKEGDWLIRDKFGDDVKISYTVYSIEATNKRGFVIRAYR